MMDHTEDLSARVLLKHILSTEPPRTPVTRSKSQAPGTSELRRSSRQSRQKAEAQTPRDVLRRSLKHKIHETITRKSVSATTKQRTPSVVLRKLPSASMLVSNEDTPRHLLRNILQTEPVKSPVVHEKVHNEEPDQQSADRTDVKIHSSTDLSGLDLPDLTVGNVASIAKRLSRKRPRRSLNVTAFEKRLKSGNGAGEEPETSADDLSSLSLSSSSSLSLKTPFADVRTEKRGLQRKVSNRRKITEKQFEAAVSKQPIGDENSFSLVEGNPCEMTDMEGFTLGLSELCVPDLTVDIVNCNTALYDHPDAMTSNFSILPSRDKPAVASPQLQTDLREAEEEKEHSRGERDKSVNVFPREEEEAATESQNEERVSDPEEEEAEAEPQTKEGQNQLGDAAAASESEEEEAESETNADTQIEEEGAADSLSEENLDDLTEKEEVSPDSQRDEEEIAAGSQPEESSQSEEEEPALGFQTVNVATVALSQDEAGSEEEEESPDSQTEEEQQIAEIEDPAEVSQSEDAEEEEDATGSQGQRALSQDEDEAGSEEEEDSPDSQIEEEGAADSQPEEEQHIAEMEDPAKVSQSEDAEEEEDAVGTRGSRALSQDEAEAGSEEEEAAMGSQTEEEGAADPQTEEGAAVSPSQNDAEDVAESQTDEEEDEEQLEGGLEVISRKARRSEGALVLPIMEARNDLDEGIAAGLPDAKSRMHTTFDLNTSAELGIGETSRTQTKKLDLAELSVPDQEHASCLDEPQAETGNSFHLHGLSLDREASERGNVSSPEDAQDSAEQEEEWDDDEEEAEVVQSKTPAFVKEKRKFFHPDPPASPSVLKNVKASLTAEALAAAKPKQVRQKKKGPAKKKAVLPKAYLMSVFRHFAKTKVSADVYPVLNEIMDKFLDRLTEDLETYAAHAKRKTIEVEDVKLLLKRQGYVNDKVPVEVLIEKYLRMEQRKLLIPIATSGNVVIPKKGR